MTLAARFRRWWRWRFVVTPVLYRRHRRRSACPACLGDIYFQRLRKLWRCEDCEYFWDEDTLRWDKEKRARS